MSPRTITWLFIIWIRAVYTLTVYFVPAGKQETSPDIELTSELNKASRFWKGPLELSDLTLSSADIPKDTDNGPKTEVFSEYVDTGSLYNEGPPLQTYNVDTWTGPKKDLIPRSHDQSLGQKSKTLSSLWPEYKQVMHKKRNVPVWPRYQETWNRYKDKRLFHGLPVKSKDKKRLSQDLYKHSDEDDVYIKYLQHFFTDNRLSSPRTQSSYGGPASRRTNIMLEHKNAACTRFDCSHKSCCVGICAVIGGYNMCVQYGK